MRPDFHCMKLLVGAGVLLTAPAVRAQQTLSYSNTNEISVASGPYAPLWFTANKYGLSSAKDKSGYIRAGIGYDHKMKNDWRLDAALDLAAAWNQPSTFIVQQAYVDVGWKKATISIGSKERTGYPLEKDMALSSGMMVEGPNARPVPQVRIQLDDYVNVPLTHKWLGIKGHMAYGLYTDWKWQKDFVAPSNPDKEIYNYYTKRVWYHSKSLALRIGNKEKFPVEFEVGLLDAAQFGGDQMYKLADGTEVKYKDMSRGFSSFKDAFIPKHESTLGNVSGNHCGSWNFALTAYLGEWKLRTYLEHYYEDHSQMFWQYGRWKDGQIGVELTLPRNKFLTAALYEGICTKDQTGPILYDAPAGSFKEIQQSGADNYFNNWEYMGWQHFGQTMGLSLIPGPQYNDDHTNFIHSSRIRANHFGFKGDPSEEWSWRMLFSSVRHFGTYKYPLDKERKQFSSLFEVAYAPRQWKGFSTRLALGLDRGNYLGNSTGMMLTLCKRGTILHK